MDYLVGNINEGFFKEGDTNLEKAVYLMKVGFYAMVECDKNRGSESAKNIRHGFNSTINIGMEMGISPDELAKSLLEYDRGIARTEELLKSLLIKYEGAHVDLFSSESKHYDSVVKGLLDIEIFLRDKEKTEETGESRRFRDYTMYRMQPEGGARR